MINAHMRRALGACTTYDTFVKATEALGLDPSDFAFANFK
jgi:alpha,alpha-trehalase